MLSNKFVYSEKITLVNDEKTIANDKEIADVLNDFFSNIIKNLNTPQKNHTDSIIENVRDLKLLSANPTKWPNTLKQFVGNLPTNCLSEFDHFVGLALKGLKAILKYRKHPSILPIKRKTKSDPVCTFNHITKEDVIKKMKNLDASKSSQEDHITTKIIKENTDIFSNVIYQSFNNMVDVSILPTSLKLANITPAYKKGLKNSKEITDRYVSCQISQKFRTGTFLSKYKIILKIISRK